MNCDDSVWLADENGLPMDGEPGIIVGKGVTFIRVLWVNGKVTKVRMSMVYHYHPFGG
jgi:hypothetical protein